MRTTLKSGHIFLVTSVLLAVIAVFGASIAAYRGTIGTAISPLSQPPTAQELVATLVRTGLSPANLATAGVSSAQANTILTAAETHFDADKFTSLRSTDVSVNSLTQQIRDLKAQIRAGQASGDGLASLQTQLTTALSNKDTILSNLFDAATASLTSETTGLIQTLHANTHRSVPIEYRVFEREDADWVHLRTSLANLSQADRLDDVEPDVVCSQFISGCDSEPAVTTARSNLTANLTSVNGVFASAMNE